MNLKKKYNEAFENRLNLKKQEFSVKVELNAKSELQSLEKLAKDVESQFKTLQRLAVAAEKLIEKKVSELRIAAGNITSFDSDFDDALSDYRGFMIKADSYYNKYEQMAEDLGIDFNQSDLYNDLENVMDELGRNYGPESNSARAIVQALDKADDILKKIKSL